ncbi:MAG: hypothetical protein ACLFVW_01120 [Phycisphaerae bacterium]
MSKKLRIVIVATLALAAFGASFMFSWSRGSSTAPEGDGTPGSQQAESPSGDLLAEYAEKASMQVQPSEAEMHQLVQDLREKRRDLDRRRRQLDQRERQIELAEELLDKQAEELEDLRLQLVAPLTTLKEATRELQESREVISRREQANIRGIAAKYERMDVDSGSQILVSMARNGQESDAVKILYYLSERVAAKMLGAIEDRELAARLIERMKRVEEEG